MQEPTGSYSLGVIGDGLTSSDIARAEKLLLQLLNDPNPADIQIRAAFARGGDGTTYRVQVVGSQRRVTIVKPEIVPPRQPRGLSALWIPHGFVFTPGNDDSPTGWGLPTLTSSVADAFSSNNLDPGLSPGRWTAGGPCGQVLITDDVTLNYPDATTRRLSISFVDDDWTAASYQAPDTEYWHGLRPRFNDFSWDLERAPTRQSMWTALVTQLDKLLSLPFLGFYDDAQLVADYRAQYGSDQSTWPPNFSSPPVRGAADGIATLYYEVAGPPAGTIADMASALSPSAQNGYLLDIGYNADNAVTMKADEAWVACGNLFWHPDDPALPTLSWFGYPSMNLPRWLVTGGWTGSVGGPIFPLEGWHYEWRGTTRYVYSKRLYAMGRCIGVLPETVISAAIRVETLTRTDGSTYQVNRIVVITWNADDQFGDSTGIAYWWKFNVWCVDLPRDGKSPLHVPVAPNGAYDVTTNPYGWQKCGSFDVSTPDGVHELAQDPQMRTIWQPWRFNGNGTYAVATLGFGPYADSYGGSGGSGGPYMELTFNEVAPGVLTMSSATYVKAIPAYETYVMAVDYGADGSFVFVLFLRFYLPNQPGMSLGLEVDSSFVEGDSVIWWTGGNGAVSDGSKFGPMDGPESWAMDAHDGALVLTHYIYDSGTASRRLRLARRGGVVADNTYADPYTSALGIYADSSYLSDTNPSYVRDRRGFWMMGYDIGITQGSSVVYTGSGTTTAPAAVSAHLASLWVSNTGDPQQMAKIDGSMRAFPLGVV